MSLAEEQFRERNTKPKDIPLNYLYITFINGWFQASQQPPGIKRNYTKLWSATTKFQVLTRAYSKHVLTTYTTLLILQLGNRILYIG